MSDPRPAEVTALLGRLRRGRCVLCAGGELGADGSFRRLVGKLLDQVPETEGARRLVESRPLMAADFVRRRLGDRFVPALRAVTASQDVGPVLRSLAGMPFAAVVTTSYDHAVERAFAGAGLTPPSYTPADVAEGAPSPKGRAVYKLLGDPSRPETIVWGASDLQRALAAGGYRPVAQNLFGSHSFLLLGFEWSDAELAILLERVLSDASAGRIEHYALIPNLGPLEREELYAIYRIRVLPDAETADFVRTLVEALRDPALALPGDDDAEGWLALLAEDPSRADAVEQLARMGERRRAAADYEGLLELYVGRAGIESERARRAEWLDEAGRMLEDVLGDARRALDVRLVAYAEQPSDEAWARCERLASATGRWADTAAELERIAAAADAPPRERARTLLRAAAIHDDVLEDPAAALAAVDAALTLAPIDEAGLALRVALLRKTRRWKELAEALGRRLLVEDSITLKAELYAELGRIFDEHLADPAQAVACLQQAVDLDPKGSARDGLEALLARRGDFAALVSLLEGRAAQATPAERSQLRRRILDLCIEQLDDPARAIACCEQMLVEAPGDPQVLEVLEPLYRQAGRMDDAVAALARLADQATTDAERVRRYSRLAATCELLPGGGRRAAEYLERIVAMEPRGEEPYRALERIYHDEQMWPQLLETYRRHAAIAPLATRISVWLELGAVCEHELGDPGLAIGAYLEVDRAEPDHPVALHALSRLYEAVHDVPTAIAVLERRATKTADPRAKAELFHRAGELARDQVGDLALAEPLFASALQADPSFLAAPRALLEACRQRGEHLKAARLLVEMAPHASNRVQRTSFLVEAAQAHEAGRENERAIELYFEALGIDPEHVDAAMRLSALLRKAGRFQPLLPIAEMLARKDAPDDVKIERLRTVAAAAEGLGDDAKALSAYAAILALDAHDLRALRGRAALLFRAEAWQEAAEALARISAEDERGLSVADQVELKYERGACARRLGQLQVAREHFEAAQRLDPTHRGALLGLLDLGEPDPQALIAAKKGLLSTASREEQVRLYVEIGEIYIDRIEDPPRALGAWQEGLKVKPDDVRLLHRMMRVYTEQKAWTQALDVIGRLVANEKLPVARAKYRYTAGIICLEHLGRFADAADYLWAAVEDDPAYARANAALEQLLRNHKSWKELARYYRYSIKIADASTAPDKQAKQLRLWSALAELYLDKVRDPARALVALEVAARLEPANVARREQLAALYAAADPPQLDKAIAEHQALLRADKTRLPGYRALERLYADQKKTDRASACTRAIACLEKRDPGPAPSGPLSSVQRPLTEELWASLRHPDEDPRLSALFAIVAPVVAAAQAQRARVPVDRAKLAPPGHARPWALALRLAAQALGVPAPELMQAQAELESLTMCTDGTHVVPVLSVGTALCDEKLGDVERAFLAGRCMALLRPERVISWLLPMPAQLAHLVDAAIALAAGPGRPPSGELAATVEGLRRQLTPVALDQLAAIGHQLAGQGTPPLELARAWLSASDRTASRAGLVLAGDVERCARLLKRSTPPTHAAERAQRILDLVWSSVTEEMFAVADAFNVSATSAVVARQPAAAG